MTVQENYPKSNIGRFLRLSLWAGCLAFVAVALVADSPAFGQDKKKKKEPQPEPLTLTTKDGVILETTWYPSDRGKKAVPLIMLHDWDGQKGDYRRLAVELQKMGYAIIVPDLRGHGQSTKIRTNDPDGPTTIDRKKMNKAQIATIRNDIDACKEFLIEQNNAGKLNIEKLCVVGSGVGALLAMEYAYVDWSVPQLPNYKIGHDVRGLVLISPSNSFKGLTNRNALSHNFVRSKLSVMIIVGAQSPRATNEAKRLHTRFERYHDPIPDTQEDRIKKQDLFYVDLDTKLQGTKMLQASGLPQNPARYVAMFLKYRLLDKDYPWAERKNPLGD